MRDATVYTDPAGDPAGVVVGGKILNRAEVEAAYLALYGADMSRVRAVAVGDQAARVQACVLPALAKMLALLLYRPDGGRYNYIEWGVGTDDADMGPLVLTLQRLSGIRPTQRAEAAEALLAQARAALAAAHGLVLNSHRRIDHGDLLAAIDAALPQKECGDD